MKEATHIFDEWKAGVGFFLEYWLPAFGLIFIPTFMYAERGSFVAQNWADVLNNAVVLLMVILTIFYGTFLYRAIVQATEHKLSRLPVQATILPIYDLTSYILLASCFYVPATS